MVDCQGLLQIFMQQHRELLLCSSGGGSRPDRSVFKRFHLVPQLADVLMAFEAHSCLARRGFPALQ